MKKVQKINPEITWKTKKQNKRGRKALVIFTLFVAVLFLMVHFVFSLKTIVVTGNERYTDKEIIELINLDVYHNALYYYLMMNQKEFESMPFIEAIDVKLTSFNDLEVQVFEKQVIGCIEFMGMYLYFDKDGRMIESLDYRSKDIPIVYGLDYKNIILYEPIPVDDPSIFNDLLNIIQMLNKYDVNINKILITNEKEFVLVEGDIRILLGTNLQMNDKIAQLKKLLPTLVNEKGELDLKQINHRIYFKKDV